MNFWKSFPSLENLSERNDAPGDHDLLYHVNAHLHTPYSFSAFRDISQIMEMAVREEVKVLGINDFNTTEGYESWAQHCLQNRVFPLFNIEFIGLSQKHQQRDIRINDPNNPGRIYLSGKGLAFPARIAVPYKTILEEIGRKANEQTLAMCTKLNTYLKGLGIPLSLSFDSIRRELSQGMVRERHLARALRQAIFDETSSQEEAINLLQIILDREVHGDPNDSATIENEIRGVLLKAGGYAYIQEDPGSFLEVDPIRKIILSAGGIPTYPILADDSAGHFTEFEAVRENLAASLKSWGFFAVEFIPTRNSEKLLELYAEFLVNAGFIVSFGSEHNTPALTPLKLYTRDTTELSPRLREINHQGACILAAHQYLTANLGQGYLDEQGNPRFKTPEELIPLGTAVLNHYFSNPHLL